MNEEGPVGFVRNMPVGTVLTDEQLVEVFKIALKAAHDADADCFVFTAELKDTMSVVRRLEENGGASDLVVAVGGDMSPMLLPMAAIETVDRCHDALVLAGEGKLFAAKSMKRFIAMLRPVRDVWWEVASGALKKSGML